MVRASALPSHTSRRRRTPISWCSTRPKTASRPKSSVLAQRRSGVGKSVPPADSERTVPESLRLPDRQESLDPFTGEDLTCVDVAFRVHRDHVQPEELATVFAHASHLTDDLAIF